MPIALRVRYSPGDPPGLNVSVKARNAPCCTSVRCVGGSNFILGIGGYAGMITSLLAFYLSAAIVVNSMRGCAPDESAPGMLHCWGMPGDVIA